MHTTLFGCRKEGTSYQDTVQYEKSLREKILLPLGFSLEGAQANIAHGATSRYRDAGGGLVEHLTTLVTPDLQQSIPVHVNFFIVTSALPDQVKDVSRMIRGYSQELDYVFRESLGDSLALI